MAEDKYSIAIDQRNGSIKVTTKSEPQCCVTVTLTSPVMRDADEEEDKTEKPGMKSFCCLLC